MTTDKIMMMLVKHKAWLIFSFGTTLLMDSEQIFHHDMSWTTLFLANMIALTILLVPYAYCMKYPDKPKEKKIV